MTRRSRLVAVDSLLLVLAVLSLVVAETGGGAVRLAGVRVSVQTWWRPALVTLVLMLVRVWAYRTAPPFGAAWSRIIDSTRFTSAPLPGAREQLLALMALATVIGVVHWPQVAHLDRVPDLGDPLFSMWRLAWVDHQILSNPQRLFQANIFYPTAAALTLSDSMILPGLTAIPLLRSGVPLAVAYNILLLSGFVLSALAAYVLARAFGFGVIASWVAGLYFGLCPFRLDHYSHLELQMTQWMPLALLSAHRVMTTGRWRDVSWLGVVLGAQWYSSMYFGMFLTFYVAVFAFALALASRCWRPLGMVALGTVAGVVVALPLARAYSASEHDRGLRDTRSVQEFSAVPLDYLQTTGRSALYGDVRIAGPRLPERILFPGVAPLVLAAVGLVPPLSATGGAFLLAGVAAFDGSLGLNGYWYPWAYRLLKPFQSIRAPARFGILVSLTLAMLAAAGVDRLARRTNSHRMRTLLAIFVTAVLVAEAWPVLKLQRVWRSAPQLYGSLRNDGGAVLFEYPMRRDPLALSSNLRYMYFSTWHWTPMVNGYSGFIPASYRDLAEATADFPDGGSIAHLQGQGVTHVTVHCGLAFSRPCDDVLPRLDADPRFTLIATTRFEGQPARLYALAR